MGLLAQPHTSAGRVPSDKGYRLYVDRLMETRSLTSDEVKAVTAELNLKIHELGAVIKNASAIISKLTKYTSVTLTPKHEETEITAVEAIGVDQHKVCIIMVLKSGTVKSNVVTMPARFTEHELSVFSGICKKRLSGALPDSIGPDTAEIIKAETLANNIGETAANQMLEAVMDCVRQMGAAEVILNGTTNIMNFPEFHNIERAREFLEILEEKKSIGNLLGELAKDERIKMLIGNENPIEEIKECSIVGATYSAGNTVFGTIGVIGPKRMDYTKVVSIIEYINGIISREIKRLGGTDGGG
jgi:heat-inducible transcriptional repressor